MTLSACDMQTYVIMYTFHYHEYTGKTPLVLYQVPLGIILKNENKLDEMVDVWRTSFDPPPTTLHKAASLGNDMKLYTLKELTQTSVVKPTPGRIYNSRS